MDKLDRLFARQSELNDKTFERNNLVNPETGKPLQMQDFVLAIADGKLAKGGAVDIWLQNYARALSQETAELLDCTPWKWWSRDKGVDLASIRVEIVDALHFWMSLAMVAGMNAEDVFKLYCEKNRINHQRQESGTYFHMHKDEKQDGAND